MIKQELLFMERIEKRIPEIAEAKDTELFYNTVINTIDELCKTDVDDIDIERMYQIIILILCRCVTYKNGKENQSLIDLIHKVGLKGEKR